MEGNLEITLLMVVTVVAGISAQVIADYLKVPSIVFLLLFGVLLGPSGFDFLHPDLLGSGLEVIVSLSVALILFEGGLNLELRELGEVSSSLRNLVTIGTLVTFLGGGMAAHWLGEFPWPIAFLYASLVVVTGPTVVSPLLKQISVERRLETLLEGEGVLIDPVGAILAVVVLNIVLDGSAEPMTVLSGLVLRLGIGGAIGIGGGWLLGLILKQARFLSEDLKNLVVLAGVWGLFGLAQVLRNESGLMTAVAAGVVLRAASLPEERLLRRFKGQLSTLAVSVLFILLAADLSLASIGALGWGGALTVLALMVVVRPINIWASTWNSDLTWRQKAFLSWIAPRGIVAASVASLFSISLSSQGINGGDAIKALVFLTIILTVLFQGLTAQWVANWLKLRSTEATGAVIVGCNPLGRLMGRLLRERGEYVAMIDTNPEYCKLAEADGLPVFLSSALDTEVLAEAGLSSVGTFLAMTSNAEVNYVLAQRAQEEFRPPRVLAVYAYSTQKTQGVVSEKPTSPAVQNAFSPQLSIKSWSQYLTDEATKLGETVLEPEKFALQTAHLQALIQAETLMPLLVERQERWQIPLENEPWQPGDRILYLLHTPRPKPLSLDSRPAVIALPPDLPPEPVAVPAFKINSSEGRG
jgi:NhaP-type Na+/H+ or K+/H+ antiporter